jgi:hypothetical protein
MGEMGLDDARAEVRNTDQLVLEAENQRFDGRLAFWERRCEEISRD